MKHQIITMLFAGVALFGADARSADPHVSRCSTDGVSSVYTDGSCRALGAKPVPMSANLMRSLVREGALGGSGTAAFGMQPTSRAQASRKDAGSGQLGSDQCARTPAELAAALRRSLGDGEVNRLASLYDWAGKSGREARPILQKLERMSDRPLIDGQYFSSSRETLAGSADGFVQLVQGPQSAPTVTELAVNRRAGCLFLNF